MSKLFVKGNISNTTINKARGPVAVRLVISLFTKAGDLLHDAKPSG